MGTDLLEKPSSDEEKDSRLDEDTPQGVYDDKFEDIINKEFNPEELKEMEESADNDSDDSEDEEKDNLEENGYYKGGGRLSGRKKAAAGIGGGIVAGGIVAFFLIAPAAKLNIMLNQIDDRVMGVTKNLVQKRISRHFENVLASKMFGYKDGVCGKVISKDCVRWDSSKGISRNLYSAWRDSNFEEKIWDTLGLEIELDSTGQNYTLRDRLGRKVNVSDGELKTGGWLDKQGKNELSREINKLLKKETKWYEVMNRKSIRKALKYKYDIDRWCFLACRDRDNLRDKYNEKILGRYNAAKIRFKYKMAERVISPVSPRYGAVLSCLAEAKSCTKDDIENRIDKNKHRIGVDDIDKLFKELGLDTGDDIAQKFGKEAGEEFSQTMVRLIVRKVLGEGSETAAKAAASGVPIVGQVYAAISAIDLAHEVWYGIDNNTLGKYASDLAATQYVQLYSSIRSNNDEMKTGKLDFAEVGAAVTEFNGAEQSKIYQGMQNIPKTNVASIFPKAYAEPAEEYKCRNGKPIPDSEYVCEEKKVAVSFFFEDWFDNPFVQFLRNTSTYELGCPGDSRNTFPPTCLREIIHPLLSGINWVFDQAGNAALTGLDNAVNALPIISNGYNSFKSFAEQKFGEAINWVMNEVFPMPIQLDSPGRDKYDGLHAGGEMTAYEFNKGGYEDGNSNGLGGVDLEPQIVNNIMEEEFAQKEYEQKTASIYEKVFDLENTSSLASTAIMMSPSTTSGLLGSISSNFGAIFNGGFVGSLGTMFSTKAKAYNAELYTGSPFGVPKFGYNNENLININPDDLTPEFCEQKKAEREASKYENEITGFIEYEKEDPCLLEQVAIESAGSLFTTAFDEDSGESGEGTSTNPTTGPVTYDPNGLPTAPIPESETAVTSNGIRLFKGIVPTVDAMIAAAAADGVSLPGSGWRSVERQIELRRNNCGPSQYDIYQKPSSQCSPPTAIPGNSNHEKGLAIDFSNMCYKNATCPPGTNPGYDWLTANAARFGFKKLSTEAWHWSVDGG